MAINLYDSKNHKIKLYRYRVSQATVIMISSLLKDSSDGFDAVLVQMIKEITNKVPNLYTIEVDRIDTRM